MLSSKRVHTAPCIFISAIALALPFSSISFAQESSVERIEVTGQINTGLVASEINLADTSSPDLREQLSQIPGVSVNGNGMLSGVVQYRGLFGDRLHIKIDDMQITGAGPNAMDSPLSHVLGSSQELVLHQGIAPVSVGYETLGGAIEIKSSLPRFSSNNEWQVSGLVSAGYYTNNDANSLSARLDTANQQSYVSLQGQYQSANNYESGNGLVVPSTFYKRSGGKLLAGYHNDNSRLDAVVGVVNTNASGTPALAMDINFIDALWYKLNYNIDINDVWQTNVKVSGNQNEHLMDNFSNRANAMPTMFRENTVDSDAAGIDLDLTRTNAQGDALSFGINVHNKSHNSHITNPNNAGFFIQNFNNITRKVSSAYAQYDFSLSESKKAIDWQLGARATKVSYKAEDVGSNMAMMNPNIATLVSNFNTADRQLDFNLGDLVLKAYMPLSKNIKGSFSVGQKERAPVYSELYTWFPLGVSGGLADGRNYIGSLDLKKESALQSDIGLQYQHNSLSIMANVFYQSIDNYIVGTPSSNMLANMIANMMGAQQPLQWNNLDAALYGADIYLSKMLSSQWQFTTSAQWVKGKLKDAINGERLPLYRVAPLSANSAIHYSNNDLDISLMLKLAASQTDVSSLQNETSTPGYGVWDMNVKYQLSEALRLSLTIENMLDKAYAQHVGGINRIMASELAVGQKAPEIGRNVGVYVDYIF